MEPLPGVSSILGHLQQMFDIVAHLHRGKCDPNGEARFLQQLTHHVPRNAPELETRDASGYTLLQHASAAGSLLIVNGLLNWGANLYLDRCSPPPHVAARFGHLDVYKLLLDKCADELLLCSCICYPNGHNFITVQSIEIDDDDSSESDDEHPTFSKNKKDGYYHGLGHRKFVRPTLAYPPDVAVAQNHANFLDLYSQAEQVEHLPRLLRIATHFGATDCIRKLFSILLAPQRIKKGTADGNGWWDKLGLPNSDMQQLSQVALLHGEQPASVWYQLMPAEFFAALDPIPLFDRLFADFACFELIAPGCRFLLCQFESRPAPLPVDDIL